MKPFHILFFTFMFSMMGAVSTSHAAKEIPNGVNINFPKVKDCNLELSCLSKETKRTFTAGQPAVLVFGLKNIGATPVTCYEWYPDESQNLIVKYAVAEEGKNPSKEDWKQELPEEKPRKRIIPLQLSPNNTVLINKNLNFISKMGGDVSKPVTFYVYVELNLKSMSARSAVVKVQVIPAAK